MMTVDELEAASYAPGDWSLEEASLSGNFKLRAEYRLEGDDGLEGEVLIRPHKSYTDQPGLCDCHRIVVREYEDGELVTGMTVADSPSQTEYLDATLELAEVVMTDFVEEVAIETTID